MIRREGTLWRFRFYKQIGSSPSRISRLPSQDRETLPVLFPKPELSPPRDHLPGKVEKISTTRKVRRYTLIATNGCGP